MSRKGISEICLVPLDTDGEWNHPLLENAAAMSGFDCIFASSDTSLPGQAEAASPKIRVLDDVLAGFQHIIACEAVRGSKNIYDFPAPRGRTAVIVGNEERGIARSVLQQADSVVAIPMTGAGMSSLNVAVSAAIALYILSKDLGRKKRGKSDLAQRHVDVLIHAPNDPHELGSLLRSAWAFGWRRVFVSDPHGVWFTRDQKAVLDSRAAARRYKNPLAVLPADHLDLGAYDFTLVCDGRREGKLLSRFRLPPCHRMLFIYGDGKYAEGAEHLFVDHASAGTEPRFRHAGSVMLSVLAEMLEK
jgi:hypothetical protein